MQDFDALRNEAEHIHNVIWSIIAATPDRFHQNVITEPEFVAAQEGYNDGKLGDDFPVMKHLDEVLNLARDHGFAEVSDAFAAISSNLPWSQNPRYTKENGGLSLLNGYAYASLSGPEGPIRCMAPRGGLYLMAPDVIYPSHNHEPCEIYLIMTPGAEWRLDEGEWFDVHPGDLIYHAPWQMHAMRSRDKPVLAYAAWLEPGDRASIGFTENPETA